MSIDWEQLIEQIADGRVVPIVGSGLYVWEEAGRARSLQSHLLDELSRTTGIGPDIHQGELQALVRAFVSRNGLAQRDDIYRFTKRAHLSGPPAERFEALRQLASIEGFKLYVSTTPDDRLLDALKESRAPDERIHTGAFVVGESSEDLDAHQRRDPPLTVYKLFGTLTATETYALTEEDYLEYLHELGQGEQQRPQNLLAALRKRTLLFLGCGFPDWSTRMLVRLLRGERLADAPPRATLSDPDHPLESPLQTFLASYQVTRECSEDPVEFVRELHARWTARFDGSSTAAEPLPASERRARAVGRQTVFLSFASENRREARKLADVWRAAGIDVWMDERELAPGTPLSPALALAIRRCAVFVPLLSSEAVDRAQGHFRREWEVALQTAPEREAHPRVSRLVARDMAVAVVAGDEAPAEAGYRFVRPVTLDLDDEDRARLPETMRELLSTPYRDARRERFVEDLRRTMRLYQLAMRSGR